MDPDDISSKDPETQLVLKCRKKPEVGDEPIQVLRERGWSRFGDTTASAIFMPGRMIFEGGLHATHKLCVCGKIAVVGKVECEGTLMLHKGSIQCRKNSAIVKNLVVCKQGHFYGDIRVTNTAIINGAFTVSGKLTITGELVVRGTLKCQYLTLNGTLTKFGYRTKLVVYGDSVINGADHALLREIKSLQEWLHDESREETVSATLSTSSGRN